MVIDISVACISGAFIILVIFLIVGIVKFNRTSKEINKLLHTTKKDLDELTVESIKLIGNLNQTTEDVKKKLHILDIFFKPFAAKQETESRAKKHQDYDVASEL